MKKINWQKVFKKEWYVILAALLGASAWLLENGLKDAETRLNNKSTHALFEEIFRAKAQISHTHYDTYLMLPVRDTFETGEQLLHFQVEEFLSLRDAKYNAFLVEYNNRIPEDSLQMLRQLNDSVNFFTTGLSRAVRENDSINAKIFYDKAYSIMKTFHHHEWRNSQLQAGRIAPIWMNDIETKESFSLWFTAVYIASILIAIGPKTYKYLLDPKNGFVKTSSTYVEN